MDHTRDAERALSEKRYVDAVNAFVMADQVERSMASLGRAFDAANLAQDPLLVVLVSERILSRPEVSDEGRTLARRAVAKASDRLTQLELVCGERECEFEVDGEVAEAGISYRLPGAHEIRLKGDAQAVLQVNCAARAICRFTLPQTEQPVAAPGPLAPSPLEPRAVAAAQPTDPEPAVAASRESSVRKSSRLPLAVLITTAVGGAGLGGLAIWSGIEAVHARNVHETDPANYDEDAVRAHARRTDYYLLGTGLCAAAAVATGLWWVDWDERRRTSLSLDGGAGLKASHHF